MSQINISEYHNFNDFISKFEIIAKEDKNINIINQGNYSKKYNISKNNIDYFFKLLNNLNGYNLNFSEKQTECNGIFIDLDKYNKTNERCYNNENLIDIVDDYFSILLKYISLEDDTLYKFNIYILGKDILNYDEKKLLFKEGYHILIPNLYLPRFLRRKMLEELKLIYEDVDINACSVPNLFYNNVKKTDINPNNKYKIIKSVEYIIKDKNKSLIKEYLLPNNCNILKELSLTFVGDINNIIYCDSDYYIDNNEINTINFEIINNLKKEYDTNTEINNDNDNIDDLEYDLELLQIKSFSVIILKDMLDILPKKYYEERTLWRNIIYGIYSSGVSNHLNFKILGEYFSRKSKINFNITEFNNLWNDTIQRYKNCNSPITEKTIYYYAKKENYEKYKDILDNSYIKLIEDEIFHNNDILTHYTIAKILYILLNKSIVYNNKNWYYFITDNKSKICYEEGLLYKWYNEASEPFTLSSFISEELKNYINIVVEKFKKTIINEDNKVIVEEYKDKIKKLNDTIKKLGDTPYKKNVIEQCKNLFRNYNFNNELDSNPNILGVKNGILILPKNKGEKTILLNDFHEYKVETYTNINYIPYDENNENIQKMYKILKDIIYEEDAFEYILTYLSTTLVNNTKDPILFCFFGSGSNGKSFFLELIKGVFGPYGKKLPLSLITDKRENSSQANSALMDLKGTRFAYLSEPDGIETINTGRLKEILGGESLSGRQLFGKQENFRSESNLLCACNYEFRINCSDTGVWRRWKQYHFKMKFCENPNPNNIFEKQIDKKLLSETIKKPEIKEALLSIFVYYYDKFINDYNGDLKNCESKTIVNETLDYRSRQDILNKFICLNVVVSENSSINVEEFFIKFKEWMYFYQGNTNNKNGLNLDEIQMHVENSILSNFMTFDPILYKKMFKGIRLLQSSSDILLDQEIPLKKYLLEKNK